LAKLHQEHDNYYIAAPLFGRPDSAETGTLLSYVAGDEKVIQSCDALFKAYTRSYVYMGPEQKIVNSIKLTMNFMLVSLIELFSEVYAFAEKSEIDPEFTEGLIQTVLAHPVMKEYTRRIREHDFSPVFEMNAGFKDVELMLQASTEVRAPLSIASLAREKFLTALGGGMGKQDWSAVSLIARKNANLE
jgi:3-hydroxyisobutyrate dehydrogenase-like beta-hydroxyacid dehydrogenase